MARCVHGNTLHTTHHVAFAVMEQMIELGAIVKEICIFIKYLSKGVLYYGDVFANANFTAHFTLYVRCRR